MTRPCHLRAVCRTTVPCMTHPRMTRPLTHPCSDVWDAEWDRVGEHGGGGSELPVRQLRHHLGAFFARFSAPPHPTRAVGRVLLGAQAYLMLIGACDPVLCPIRGFSSSTRSSKPSRTRTPACSQFETSCFIPGLCAADPGDPPRPRFHRQARSAAAPGRQKLLYKGGSN